MGTEAVRAWRPPPRIKSRALRRGLWVGAAIYGVVAVFTLEVDPARVADGTYEAESLGYEANVRVAVTVKDKKIEQVKITQHREKQFYSSLTDTPTKIIAKQGVKGVDATAAATITSEAIINATAKALASGAK